MSDRVVGEGLRPPICRVGSKRRFAELLTHILPPHRVYVEPFAGSAAIFFYKKPVAREVLNDLDKTVTETYKLIQQVSPDAKFPDLNTEEKVKAFWHKKPNTKEERLVWNLIRACGGWMGKPARPGDNKSLIRFSNPLNKLQHIRDYKDRLRGVHITNEDYATIIAENDGADTVFFMDPPYEESAGIGYAKGSATFDFQRFAHTVAKIKGKWLITINDSPYIRSLFKGFHIEPVLIVGHHKKTGNFGKSTTIGSLDRPELLISNFPLPRDAEEFAPPALKFQ